MAATVRARALGEHVAGVIASTLGLTAAARGGAHLALARVFADPGTVAPRAQRAEKVDTDARAGSMASRQPA